MGLRMARKTAAPRQLRADARRNVESLRAAALEAFDEHGLNTPLEDIAKRAGVSIGTLYNRFGSRGALIDAVVSGLAAERLGAVVARSRQLDGAWEQFACFLGQICELQAANPALNDMVTRRFPEATQLMAVCDATLASGSELIANAQNTGDLRADFTDQDLYAVLWANASLVELGLEIGDDTLWSRHLRHLLEGLRIQATVSSRR
jgi:AcrR family transcriptional regulator